MKHNLLQSADGHSAGRAAALRPPRRLVVRDLPDADLARVAGVLRSACATGRPAWTLGFAGEADVLLWAGDDAAPVAASARPGTLIVQVVGAAAPVGLGATLRRPIDPAALLAVLDAAAAPRPASAPAAIPGSLPRDARFRLRRWPPDALLDPPHRRRLAGHLSTHVCDMVSLATTCKVPLLRCCEFVADLHAARLLVIEMPTTASGAPVRAASC